MTFKCCVYLSPHPIEYVYTDFTLLLPPTYTINSSQASSQPPLLSPNILKELGRFICYDPHTHQHTM